jgi:hypothetical protein
MLLSVVFLQQAPLNKMRAIFLKTYALLISLHDSWEIVEMTQYSRRPSVSCGWKVSGLRWIPGTQVETVRRKTQSAALANGK